MEAQVASMSAEYRKRYRQEHKEKLTRQINQWFVDNKDENREYRKKQRMRWNKLNADKIREYGVGYRRNNLERHREYEKSRLKSDPLFKLAKSLRSRLRLALKAKSWHKDNHFKEYIGCTESELKVHLEKQFQPEMTWENHGKWHIDHIIPLSSAATPEELYKLCHHTNLQPLWAQDNLKKQDKYNEDSNEQS